MSDDAELLAVLASLPAERAAALVPYLPTAVRRRLRNQVIIATVREHYADRSRTAGATAMAADMRFLDVAPEIAGSLRLILALNQGSGLSARQLVDVIVSVSYAGRPESLHSCGRTDGDTGTFADGPRQERHGASRDR
jgi:hypothetical protein